MNNTEDEPMSDQPRALALNEMRSLRVRCKGKIKGENDSCGAVVEIPAAHLEKVSVEASFMCPVCKGPLFVSDDTDVLKKLVATLVKLRADHSRIAVELVFPEKPMGH